MSELFEVKKTDRDFYETKIKDFLPPELIDIHTHVWRKEFIKVDPYNPVRAVTWPSLVAADNPIEDHLKTYELMFPDKKVTPMIFSTCNNGLIFDVANKYIADCSEKYNLPSLLLSTPEWDAEEFERKIQSENFLGAKVYLNFSPSYIPESEIRIFDFIPPHQLKVLDKLSKILMLHIPRHKRLRDPVNLAQMLEIEKKYPHIKFIIAHVGRAYCNEDIGDAFEVLSETKNMLFDFSANTNQYVFESLIKAVGPKRIMFGSDMPILRMRNRRIIENGTYINVVPKGLYGDVSADKNMREVEGSEADSITFFMYEEIDAFRKASISCGLNSADINDIFYTNAKKLIESVRGR